MLRATRRCWAPSWRSRSIRLSSSPRRQDGGPALAQRLDLASQLAALRGADQVGHHTAMQGHHELGKRRGDGQQHEPDDRQDDPACVSSTGNATGTPGTRPPATTLYHAGRVSSDSDTIQATATTA